MFSVKVPLPGRHMQDLDPSKILIELTCLLNVVVNHAFWQTLFSLKDQVDRKKNIFSTSVHVGGPVL